MGIGKKLKALRKQNNFSAKEVCKKLKEKNFYYSENMLYKWEEDRNNPDIYTIIELCNIFKSSLSEILGYQYDYISNNIYNLTAIESKMLSKYREDENFKKFAIMLLNFFKK